MKWIITAVIIIAIAFILTCRFSRGPRTFYNVKGQPVKADSQAEADLDFPAMAGGLLIRQPFY